VLIAVCALPARGVSVTNIRLTQPATSSSHQQRGLIRPLTAPTLAGKAPRARAVDLFQFRAIHLHIFVQDFVDPGD
jgi:hypothetical protein